MNSTFGYHKEILTGVLNPLQKKEENKVLFPFGNLYKKLYRIQNDPNLDGYNAPSYATDLINFAQETADAQNNEKNIMILFGDNFFLQNAQYGYTQL